MPTQNSLLSISQIDTTPIAGSSNLITSGGVKTALSSAGGGPSGKTYLLCNKEMTSHKDIMEDLYTYYTNSRDYDEYIYLPEMIDISKINKGIDIEIFVKGHLDKATNQTFLYCNLLDETYSTAYEVRFPNTVYTTVGNSVQYWKKTRLIAAKNGLFHASRIGYSTGYPSDGYNGNWAGGNWDSLNWTLNQLYNFNITGIEFVGGYSAPAYVGECYCKITVY